MYTEEIYILLKRAFKEVHPKYPFPTAEKFADAPEKYRAAIGYFASILNNVIRESNVEWIKAQKEMYIVELNHQNKKISLWKSIAIAAILFGVVSFSCLVLVSEGILVLG